MEPLRVDLAAAHAVVHAGLAMVNLAGQPGIHVGPGTGQNAGALAFPQIAGDVACGAHDDVGHVGVTNENYDVGVEFALINRGEDHIVDRVANGDRNVVIQAGVGVLVAEHTEIEASLTGGAKRGFLDHAEHCATHAVFIGLVNVEGGVRLLCVAHELAQRHPLVRVLVLQTKVFRLNRVELHRNRNVLAGKSHQRLLVFIRNAIVANAQSFRSAIVCIGAFFLRSCFLCCGFFHYRFCCCFHFFCCFLCSIFYCFFGILIGARLGHCLFYDPGYYLSHFWEMILPIKFMPDGNWKFTGYEGLASHGGTLGLIIALWLYCRKTKLHYMDVLDMIAVATPITACFIRLANLMNSEIIGKPSDVPWAFVFERVDMLPRHPGQLYEAIAYLILFFIMIYLYKNYSKKLHRGFFFGLCLTYIFTFRFFIEFLKENQEDFENSMMFNMGQWLSVPFIIIGVYFMFFYDKKKKKIA